jgi:molybdate transport system substrate-binding protein
MMRATVILTVAALAATSAMAQAAEVVVLSTVAYKGALDRIVPLFEKASGDHVTVHYGSAAAVATRLKGGEACDAAITTTGAIEALTKEGVMRAQPRTMAGVSSVALAYRKGEKAPDVSTPEKLKATLLAAKSISSSDPAAGGASAVYFLEVADRMGIGAQVRAKEILTKPGDGAAPVLRGEAQYGVAMSSEVAPLAGLERVALAPNDPKGALHLSAAVSAKAGAEKAAAAFVTFLATPAALEIRKGQGL